MPVTRPVTPRSPNCTPPGFFDGGPPGFSAGTASSSASSAAGVSPHLLLRAYDVIAKAEDVSTRKYERMRTDRKGARAFLRRTLTGPDFAAWKAEFSKAKSRTGVKVSKAKRDQARFTKAKGRTGVHVKSSWSLRMSGETTARMDVAQQAELDYAVQVELEIYELAKIHDHGQRTEWTFVHAGRYKRLQKLAKELRSRTKKHKGFTEAIKDAQFAAQRTGPDGDTNSYCPDCGART